MIAGRTGLLHAMGAYVRALLRHWIALMGGAICGVVLPIAEKLSGIEVLASLYAVLAALCVLIATFQAWREQYQRAADAEDKAWQAVARSAPAALGVDPVIAKRKRIFASAVNLLRATHGRMFPTSDGATSGLPGVLWYRRKPNWNEVVERLGEVERQRGRFRPFVEPSQFDGSDEVFVTAAEEILHLYLWGAENHPDFEAIRAKFGLVGAGDVRKLLERG